GVPLASSFVKAKPLGPSTSDGKVASRPTSASWPGNPGCGQTRNDWVALAQLWKPVSSRPENIGTSSSTMSPGAVSTPRRALDDGLEMVNTTVSSGSGAVSPITETGMETVRWPAGMVAVPEVET